MTMRVATSAARLQLLLLLVCCFTVTRSASATAHADEVTHLYPEQPRASERLLCGTTQLYRVHDLDTTKVYDIKVSYPASVPTEFSLEVLAVQLPASLLRAYTAATATDEDNDSDDANDPSAPRTMRVRRLNTAKLRLHPQELLLHKLHETYAHQQQQQQHHATTTYRLDVAAAVHSLEQQQPMRVTLDIALHTAVEGVSPVRNPRVRECVYDIVVEEMLFGGAFPHSTLVLIAWLLLLLAVAFVWAYPRLLRLLTCTIEHEHDRAHTIRFGDSSSSSRKQS